MDRRAPPREQAPPAHRRELPPPSLRSAPQTPAKRPGGAPPFNRLQLAAALLEYEEEGGPTQDGDSTEAHDGAARPTRAVKRAADSAIFTPYRSAPRQLDYFSDLVLPGAEAGSEARKRTASRTSIGSSGFGLAATTVTKAGPSLVEPQSEGEPDADEPAAEEDEVETLAEWGLDGLLGQLGTGLPERARKPSKTRSTGAYLDLHARQTDEAAEDSTAPDPLPPPSPASATHSLPDRLDRRIFRPPSSASHPLLKGHAVLATRTALGHLSVSDANDRRRAQSFDAVQRPSDFSPSYRSPIAQGPSSPRPRRVTMLDRPHAATSLDLPRPQKRSFPAKARPRAAKTSAGSLGRTSMDIAERYRQSIAMLTEPMEFGTDPGLGSADFRVPLPSEYTSRFDPKVAEMMQRHKDRDAELNAQPRRSVPEVIVEGDPGDLASPLDEWTPVYDDQNRIRFPGSLNPKVLIMPAPLTPPELEHIEEPRPPEEEVQASPPKIERPAGKLYGRSLIDELRERKAAQRSRQRAYAGDDRPRMFSNSCSANDLSLVADESNTVAFPTSHSANTLAALGGRSAAVAHARSLYASATMASSRAQASVFGIDLLMQRELAKVAKMEAEEAVERAERRRVEEERENLEAAKKRKKEERKGKKAVKQFEEPAVTDEDWHEPAEEPAEFLADTPPTPAPPIVSEKAPSLDLPTSLARRGSVNLDRLFDGDGSSSDEDDGFSDANSIARRLEAKSPSSAKMPALRHQSSGTVASVQRAQSVLSHAGRLAPDDEEDEEGSSEDEALSSLVQKKKAERELPPLVDFGVQGGFGVLYAQPQESGSTAGTDSDDEPLGTRVSVRLAPPALTNDSDDEDLPLAVRRSTLSMHSLAASGRGWRPGLTSPPPACGRRRPNLIVPSVAGDLGQVINSSEEDETTRFRGLSNELLSLDAASQPVSPAVPSAQSSQADRIAARKGTLDALEGHAIIDEDADDEVPLGYNMAMLDRRRPSTKTLPTVDDDDDDDDDQPLALRNPMAMATRQVEGSQTMLLLMQQQNAAFASAAMTPYGYGAALGAGAGLPFPPVPIPSAASGTFASHEPPFDLYQHPQMRQSIARWRVEVEGEPPTAST